MSTSEVESLLKDFRDACKKTDNAKAQTILTKLKIGLTHFSLLPPFTGDISTSKKQLSLARETLELASLLSIRSKDIPSFTRHLTQLKVYYQDYAALLPPSDQQAPLLGLYLLSLLAHNKLADFHTELELLTHTKPELVSSPHIRFAMQVEQQLMEGCYNQVLAASTSNSNKLPAPEYAVFLETLVATVREKIGDCSEVAYKKLPLAQARQLLQLKDEKELREFITKRGEKWYVDEKEKTVVFRGIGAEQGEIQNFLTIRQTLHYATELERIV